MSGVSEGGAALACLILVLAFFIIMLAATIRFLNMLSRVPPLSPAAVSVVAAYALLFTLSVVVLLAAISVILSLAQPAWEPTPRRTPQA